MSLELTLFSARINGAVKLRGGETKENLLLENSTSETENANTEYEGKRIIEWSKTPIMFRQEN